MRGQASLLSIGAAVALLGAATGFPSRAETVGGPPTVPGGQGWSQEDQRYALIAYLKSL